MRPITTSSTPATSDTVGVLILGAAGQRVNTAAEILCLSAMHGGFHATQKNDYPITVLRGHSISEVILSPQPIGFTGIEQPDIILALSPEGVERRKTTISGAKSTCLILQEAGINLPETSARVIKVDCTSFGIAKNQRALALLAVMTKYQPSLNEELLYCGLKEKFKAPELEEALELVNRFHASSV